MEMPQPTAEHRWLQRLVGNWTFEVECQMGPDQPPMKNQGRESVRSLGALWTIGEWDGETPDGGQSRSVITLGYNPVKQRFVGTFINDMMTHLWPYEGTLDAAGKILTLDSEGPSMSGEGLAKYQDIIEFIDDNHRKLSSQIMGADGQWQPFMTAHFYRQSP